MHDLGKRMPRTTQLWAPLEQMLQLIARLMIVSILAQLVVGRTMPRTQYWRALGTDVKAKSSANDSFYTSILGCRSMPRTQYWCALGTDVTAKLSANDSFYTSKLGCRSNNATNTVLARIRN